MNLFILMLRILLTLAALYAFSIGLLMNWQNYASGSYFLWVGLCLLAVMLIDFFVQKQKI